MVLVVALIFEGGLDDLEDHGASRLVVGAENRGPVAANDVVAIEGGLDAATGLHRVHVGRQQNSLAVSSEPPENIAVGVLRCVDTKRLQTPFELGGDGVLVARGRLNRHQLEECTDETVAVDQLKAPPGGVGAQHIR